MVAFAFYYLWFSHTALFADPDMVVYRNLTRQTFDSLRKRATCDVMKCHTPK